MKLLSVKSTISTILCTGSDWGSSTGLYPWDDDIGYHTLEKTATIYKHFQGKSKWLYLETDKNYFNNFIKVTDSTLK